MKAFISALVILILLLTGVSVNALFLSRALSDLSLAAMAVPEPDKDDENLATQQTAINELYIQWNKVRFLAGITVSHANLNDVDLLFDSILGATKTGNTDEYVIAIAQLITVLDQLTEMISLSPKNIL